MNKILLIGNVTKDIELQETTSNEKCARFTLAVNCGLEKDGTKHVDFFNCIAFRTQAASLAKYVKKGAKLAIIAQMKSLAKTVKDVTVTYWTAFVENFEFLPSVQAAEKPVEPDDYMPF